SPRSPTKWPASWAADGRRPPGRAGEDFPGRRGNGEANDREPGGGPRRPLPSAGRRGIVSAQALEGRRTPLYARHEEMGARMIVFGGWVMPVEYSGIIAEH